MIKIVCLAMMLIATGANAQFFKEDTIMAKLGIKKFIATKTEYPGKKGVVTYRLEMSYLDSGRPSSSVSYNGRGKVIDSFILSYSPRGEQYGRKYNRRGKLKTKFLKFKEGNVFYYYGLSPANDTLFVHETSPTTSISYDVKEDEFYTEVYDTGHRIISLINVSGKGVLHWRQDFTNVTNGNWVTSYLKTDTTYAPLVTCVEGNVKTITNSVTLYGHRFRYRVYGIPIDEGEREVIIKSTPEGLTQSVQYLDFDKKVFATIDFMYVK